jgi:hypothetical protein
MDTLTFQPVTVGPTTVVDRDFVAVFPANGKPPQSLLAREIFVDSGAVVIAAGEQVDDPIGRPVIEQD